MVNYQTSQYELLNLFCYLSRLGVFQYVRNILQFTVSLDHPVLPHYAMPYHVSQIEVLDKSFCSKYLSKSDILCKFEQFLSGLDHTAVKCTTVAYKQVAYTLMTADTGVQV